ncbi:MAG: type II toxin-antitoxin system VapC family toxin [Pseudonocardiaceae bacterium]
MIFVDTSFWFVLRRRRDPNHELAQDLLEKHGGQPLVTSNHVRGETWTLINRREGHRAAVVFLDALSRSPRLHVEYVTDQLELQALSWLRQRDDRKFSFVDATSFAVMRHRSVRDALAFDGGFAAAGFIELR